MCKKTTCGVLFILAVAHSCVLADELIGLSDVTVENGAIISLRYEGKEYVVAEGDLLLGTTSRWYIQGGTEMVWEEGAAAPAQTVSGTSNVKTGDVGSQADNFLFTENGATNISSIDGIDFQQTIFTFASNIFFLFERGGNDSGIMQAIYADGSLGDAVSFTGSTVYANTGVGVNGQNGFGVVFLTKKPAVGVRITASGHDTLSISAPVPVPVLAVLPDPADDAEDVARSAVLGWTPGIFAVTHNVYLGESFTDVNNATVPTAAALDVNTFDPVDFEFDKTYYWRVDEVNGTPDRTVFKGSIWSFTAEPYSIIIPGSAIDVTASSVSNQLSPPENTINGSGLDAEGRHATANETMWFTAAPDLEPWIQYEFDGVKKLDVMKVWNSNGLAESSIGWGVKDVQVEYSVNGEDWDVLEGVNQLSRAPGLPGYDQYDVIAFNGIAAQYVRLNIQSNWGGILTSYSLSEVQFFMIPTQARTPVPASGSVDVRPDSIMTWRAGRDAAQHIVSMSTDPDALIEGSAASITSMTNRVDLRSLNVELDETYYWRVDEVNDAETVTVWASPVWQFSTSSSLVVDDFESYGNLSPDRPFQTWLDGFGYSADDFFPIAYNGNGTGSGVGHDIWSPSSPHFDGSIMEQTVTISGSTQSLPFYFSNAGGAGSQIDRKWSVPQDWTVGGAQTLVVNFYGDPGNTGQLYVKVNNGSTVTYNGQASAMTTPYWTQWNINLTSLGVNLQSVTQLSFGVASGSGLVYIDDISLYKEAPTAASEQIWIEAESAAMTAPMQVYSDKPDASGGSYIGTDDLGAQGDQSDGIASFTFTVQGGTYKINARVIAADAADSFWIRLPGATLNTTPPAANNGWIRYNGIPLGDAWHWDDIHNDEDGSIPVQFILTSGIHTLDIAWREDGALLDAIVITDQL
jgi:hypothetical protein